MDTCGETGSLGFSIEGPSQAKINCKDNGDGSADVEYLPTAVGEYAVHILCDKEDIPGDESYKHFLRTEFTNFRKKLECLFLEILYSLV